MSETGANQYIFQENKITHLKLNYFYSKTLTKQMPVFFSITTNEKFNLPKIICNDISTAVPIVLLSTTNYIVLSSHSARKNASALTWFIRPAVTSISASYVIRCTILYQSLFGICMIVRTHPNAC